MVLLIWLESEVETRTFQDYLLVAVTAGGSGLGSVLAGRDLVSVC